MKQIGIREAQTKLTTLLNDLPFEITRYGKVIAIVTKPGETNEPAPKKSPVEKVTVTPRFVQKEFKSFPKENQIKGRL